MITRAILFEEFAGRDDELRHVVELHARSARTGTGAVVSISGEGGIGKSRFLSEVAIALARERGAFIRVRCEEVPVAFAPIASALQSLAERGDLRRRGVLSTALARLSEVRTEKPSDAAEYQAATIGMIVAAIGEAARRLGQLTLAFDDVQWSDIATLDVLCALSRAIDKSPVLVLFAYRPTDLANDHTRGALVTKLEREGADRLSLAGLAYPEMNRLIRKTVSHAPDETIRRIYELSEGRPYVAEELARSYVERGPSFDQRASLPLRSAILDRLGTLTPNERGVVERAAVLGRNFRADDLFATESAPSDVLAALRSGVALQLFEEREVDDRPWFRFRHALTREIVYREMNPIERRNAHLTIADYFETLEGRLTEFAYHVSTAGDAARAGPANERAGDRVAEIAASSDAANLYAKALNFISEPDALARIARKYVEALANVSDVEELARKTPEIADRLAAHDRVEDAMDVLLTAINVVGSLNFEYAQRLLEQMGALLSPSTPPGQRFRLELQRARLLVEVSRYEEAEAACRRAATALDAMPDATPRDRLNLMRFAAMSARDEAAMADVRAAYERALQTQDWEAADEAMCHAVIGIWEFDAMHVQVGFEHLAQAARIRERTGAAHFMFVYQTAAYMAAEAGEFAFTRAALERLESEGRDVGEDLGQGLSRLVRACGGDPQPCMQRFERALAIEAWAYAGGYAADLAFSFEETPARARAIALRAFAAMPPASVAKSDLVQAVVEFGTIEEARRAIAAIPAQSEIDHVRFGLTTTLARARLARREHRALEAKQIASEALAIAAPSGAWVYASAAYELANDIERAREVLASARATAELARFERRHGLAVTASTSEKSVGPVLTRREEQIARAIVVGASTREVAEHLAIAPRTVDTHLANIYEKLGINSRLQLAKFLESLN